MVNASAEDEAIMARFLDDYLNLLDARVRAIRTHLDSRDDLTAHVAMLSLESTSSMVGAKELATIVSMLRGSVERGDRQHIPALVQAMQNESERVKKGLLH